MNSKILKSEAHLGCFIYTYVCVCVNIGFPKNLPANTGEAGAIPRLGKSPGERNVNPLQYTWPGRLQSMGSQNSWT